MVMDTWGAAIILVVSTAAVGVVFLSTCISIFLVFSIKSVFGFVAWLVLFIGELLAAIVAAITSGATISLAVIVAAGTAAMTLPPSSIQARVGVSAAVSGAAIVTCACAILHFTTLNIDLEIVASIVSAAALSVAFAAAWAVGVMSLIEKETQHVGLKMTSIMDAVRHNNHRFLRILVRLHAGLKQRDLDLALLYAVKVNFPECTEILLTSGANPDAHDSYENTPLVLACEAGNLRLAKILLDAGCGVNVTNGIRNAALHLASKWGYDDCVRLLLSRGANVNIQDAQWRTPLMLATGHANPASDVIRLLIEAGCDVGEIGMQHLTALHFAAMRGLDIRILLEAGADAHAQDSDLNTPLHLAAKNGRAEVIGTLLSVGCDPNGLNSQRKSPLHFAAMNGDMGSIRHLIAAGSNPSLPELEGNLPIWYAARHGYLKVVRFFVQRNYFPLSSVSEEDYGIHVTSPLFVTIEKLHLLVARMLVFAGCNTEPLVLWLADVPPDIYSETDLGHISWLRDFTSNPSTLAHLTRLVIRRCVGKDLMVKERRLPLPSSIRQYVCMKDLDDDEWLEKSTSITSLSFKTTTS